MMFTAPCPRCQGQGVMIKSPCESCRGQGMVEKLRKVTVGFPAGIDSGQRLRVPGQGMPAPRGGETGDLYVDIQVADDARFERDGADLATRLRISFPEAALGAEVLVPTLSADDANATTTLRVPPGTQSGSAIAIKGQGVPRLDGRGRGQLLVVVDVEVPSAISTKARELLTQLREELGLSSPQKKAAE
jgi:molecular chaperone DnaJ